jgi:hypothetical protein
MLGIFRPRVFPELVQKNPKALTYQSLAKVDEGLTQDVDRITETIRSYVRDEGLNILTITTIGIHVNHIS